MNLWKKSNAAAVLGILLTVLFSTGVGLHAAASPDEAFRQRKIIARWYLTTKHQVEMARARGIDVLEDYPDLRQGYFTILASESELAALRGEGFRLDVLNHDWYATYAAGAQVPNGGFRTWAQAVAFMDSIHTNHPSITTAKFSIGFTYEGRPIWAMKISDNPDIDEPEPQVLFTGMHHAREPIGMEVVLETMKRLTDGYGTDTLITRLVNEREIFFIPVVNVDGYEYNRITNPNGGGMWRKNREENADGSYGVDLNRNYGHKWGYDNVGSSPDPTSETYRGTAAFSEPGTAAMRAFINAHNFVFVFNYHSYSNLYLWPWGYDFIYTPDEALFAAVGDSLSSYNGYAPTVGWRLYRTNGDADDWGYGASSEHTPIYSFTPEVGNSNDGFWPPVSRIPTLIAENQGPNLVIIDLAENPQRIFPPSIPTWATPDTVTTADFNLAWSDPGGLNAAVAYQLEELTGPYDKTDDAEGTINDWSLAGFTQSSARYASGVLSYYGGHADGLQSRMVAAEPRLVQSGDNLQMNIWYDIEQGWDYAYVEVSTDGGVTFSTLPGNVTTTSNPNGNNRGNGITGSSGGFVNATFDLSAYVGQSILVRLSYETDGAVLGEGVYFDDIGPLQAYTSVVTLAAATPDTFYAITGQTNGAYLYRVRSTDGEGQHSGIDAPHTVTVLHSMPGDLSNDGAIDATDLTALIDYVFFGGPGGVVPGSEECNGVAGVNVEDIVYLINYIFRGGPSPVGLP